MESVDDRVSDEQKIVHAAVVLGITYTLTPEDKADRLREDILRYEERYGAFDVQSNPQVERILGGKL
jgi:hypothetical protein